MMNHHMKINSYFIIKGTPECSQLGPIVLSVPNTTRRDFARGVCWSALDEPGGPSSLMKNSRNAARGNVKFPVHASGFGHRFFGRVGGVPLGRTGMAGRGSEPAVGRWGDRAQTGYKWEKPVSRGHKIVSTQAIKNLYNFFSHQKIPKKKFIIQFVH